MHCVHDDCSRRIPTIWGIDDVLFPATLSLLYLDWETGVACVPAPTFLHSLIYLQRCLRASVAQAQHRHRSRFNGLIYVRLMRVGGPQPQIHWIEWTCAHFNTLTKLSITAKANWQPLTQTQTIPIDRLLSSHLKNMLLMGEWGTWNHFQGDIKAALWGGVVVITPHRPALKKAI